MSKTQFERQIVLDTETTGLEYRQGHRIIEIGCVELINRKLTGNNYHVYLNPECEIEPGAVAIHGITNEDLDDKPLFGDIYRAFLEYIKGSELVIHNAQFDIGFLNEELNKLGNNSIKVEELCGVYDTLIEARKLFPGQRNDLDSLCKRYHVDNTHRELHGALLDAEILADVYLIMTGGQESLLFEVKNDADNKGDLATKNIDYSQLSLPLVKVGDEELENHVEWLERLDKSVEGQCIWSRLNDKQKLDS